MTVTIRDGTEQDGPALLTLWEAAWTVAMPSINFGARLNWFKRHLQELQVAGARLLVAESQRKPVGFVTIDPVMHLVDQLAVAPSWQGRGVGHQLLDAAKRVSPDELRLSVNCDNPRAVAFYRRAGFVVLDQGTNARSGLPVQRMVWRPG